MSESGTYVEFEKGGKVMILFVCLTRQRKKIMQKGWKSWGNFGKQTIARFIHRIGYFIRNEIRGVS